MLNIFKNWISTILGIGILFTMMRIILPRTKLNKYTYSLMGIITIIVILNPVIEFFKTNTIEDIAVNMNSDGMFNFEYMNLSGYEMASRNNVKEAFSKNIAEDIKRKLTEKVSGNVEVELDITHEYEIDNITIKMESNNSFDVTTFVSNEYDVSREKIHVIKGGA